MDRLLLVIALAYCTTFCGTLVLRHRVRFSSALAIVVVATLIAVPWFIPPEHSITRGLAVFLCTDLLLKTLDYLRQLRRPAKERESIGELLRFLVPFPILLPVWEIRQQRLDQPIAMQREVGLAVLAAGGFALGACLMYSANQLPLLRESFFADHCVKLAIVVILVESASQFAYRLERLAGYRTTPTMQNIITSRTVGEFWSRWNSRIHHWLRYNVFFPVGGQDRLVRGIVCSFLFSALLHEVMLGVATARFDGYQFLFFTIQIPPVLLSRRLERWARRRGTLAKAICHLLTIGWISVTSILFFPAIDRVFPFYYASDGWLP